MNYIPQKIPLELYARYKLYLLLNQWNLSLPCPEDVGKLSNLVKYCVCFLSYFLFLSCGYFSAASISIGGFLIGSCPRTTSGIKASQVRRGIVYQFQEHWLLFSGDRVSISKQCWDCLWDHVSISKQHLDCLRNQIWRSRSLWKLF